MRTKYVPQRTCVVCASKSSKRELTRIVRAPDGSVSVDETGKLNGRGAYLCQEAACWDAGLRGGRVAKALRTQVSEADEAMLSAYATAHHPGQALAQ